MKNSDVDFSIYILFGFAVIAVLFFLPELVILILVPFFLFMVIASSGTNDRDAYHKSKKNLKWLTLYLAGAAIMTYLMVEFVFKPTSNIIYIIASFLFFIFSILSTYLTKKIYPIRFLEDDDRLVQEKMYDYIEGDIDSSFMHRVLKTMKLPGKKRKYPTLIDTREINPTAYDEIKKEIPISVKKEIIDIFNDCFKNSFKMKSTNIKLYGYSLNRADDLESLEKFEKYLENFSYFYYMVFQIIKTELNSVGKEINYNEIKKQNKGIIELMLFAMFGVARHYKNIPIGNMAAAFYKKDKNNFVANLNQYYKDKRMYKQNYSFFGALSSLPADIKDVSATTINATGIAIYFSYYKLNEKFFNENTDEEIIKKWLI